jgi:D-3-phosphoglycerate dehydrogenase / 2-oxoglutarate reductase
LHGSSPRLMRYNGIDVEAELAGTLLIVRNNDVPGVIGRIGTILGESQLNIANFALGRQLDGPGAETRAVAVVQVDNPAHGALRQAVERLRAVENIKSVRVVELGSR